MTSGITSKIFRVTKPKSSSLINNPAMDESVVASAAVTAASLARAELGESPNDEYNDTYY